MRPSDSSPLIGRGTVGDDLALLDLLAELDDRFLVETGVLVETGELAQRVVAFVDPDAAGIDIGDGAGFLGPDDHAAVVGHVFFHAGRHEGRLGDQQRHRLALHVRTHEGPVGVVVFQERDQARRYPDHLLGRNVDVLYLVGIDVAEIAAEPSDDTVGGYLVTFCRRVGRRQVSQRFLVGAQLANARR